MKSIIAILSVLTLAACGGGGGGSGVGELTITKPTTPGIDKAGIAYIIKSETLSASPSGESLGKAQVALAGRVTDELAVDINGKIGLDVKYKYNAKLTKYSNNDSIAESGTQTDYIYAADALEGSLINAQILTENLADNINADVVIDVSLKRRSDIDIVNGPNSSAYYITNEGTGVNDNSYANSLPSSYYSGSISKFAQEVNQAHKDGWAGHETYIYVRKDYLNNDGILTSPTAAAGNIAPGATITSGDVYNNIFPGKTALVKKPNQDIYVGDGQEIDLNVGETPGVGSSYEAALLAGGVAIVWNKYSTLYDDQIVDLVNSTATNGNLNLSAALSPVGNLN